LRTCPVCGSEATAPARVKVPVKAPIKKDTLTCPRCSHENLPGFKFCSVCGELLSDRSAPPRKIRFEHGLEPPYLRLSDWPFSSLYSKTQTYAQWVNYIMLTSVSVLIFVLVLAASGEGCIAGAVLMLFGLFAFWYWLAGRSGATSSKPMAVLDLVNDSAEPVEREQWHRRM